MNEITGDSLYEEVTSERLFHKYRRTSRDFLLLCVATVILLFLATLSPTFAEDAEGQSGEIQPFRIALLFSGPLDSANQSALAAAQYAVKEINDVASRPYVGGSEDQQNPAEGYNIELLRYHAIPQEQADIEKLVTQFQDDGITLAVTAEWTAETSQLFLPLKDAEIPLIIAGKESVLGFPDPENIGYGKSTAPVLFDAILSVMNSETLNSSAYVYVPDTTGSTVNRLLQHELEQETVRAPSTETVSEEDRAGDAVEAASDEAVDSAIAESVDSDEGTEGEDYAQPVPTASKHIAVALPDTSTEALQDAAKSAVAAKVQKYFVYAGNDHPEILANTLKALFAESVTSNQVYVLGAEARAVHEHLQAAGLNAGDLQQLNILSLPKTLPEPFVKKLKQIDPWAPKDYRAVTVYDSIIRVHLARVAADLDPEKTMIEHYSEQNFRGGLCYSYAECVFGMNTTTNIYFPGEITASHTYGQEKPEGFVHSQIQPDNSLTVLNSANGA